MERGGQSGISRLADHVTEAVGSPAAAIIAFVVVLAWAVSGPIFKFSETWQLVINTGTTIVTFMMVFLIQNTQNRETKATQLKLDELIRVLPARNEMMAVEEDDNKKLKAKRQEFRAERKKGDPPHQDSV